MTILIVLIKSVITILSIVFLLFMLFMLAFNLISLFSIDCLEKISRKRIPFSGYATELYFLRTGAYSPEDNYFLSYYEAMLLLPFQVLFSISSFWAIEHLWLLW